jgi:two-component system LytT family response regulator
MPITTVIADDERPAREFLKNILAGFGDVEFVGEAESGTEALALIRELRPELAILDLQMPGMTGLEVVRNLSEEEMPLVAFVTAYDDHAVQAFEVNAIDYLLKPVESDRVAKMVARVAERLSKEDWRAREAESVRDAAAVYEAVARQGFLERIPVKKRDDIVLVPVADVSAVEADGELLHISTVGNDRFVINYRLKDIESRLDPSKFVRLSRSAIVAVDQVDRISPLPGGMYVVTMKNGGEHQSSRQQSRVLRERLLRL